MVHISFNGQVLGQFNAEQISEMLESGKITRDAFYFQDGMTEWKPLAELIEAEPAPTPKRTKNSPTKTQIKYLEKRGLQIPEGLTKDQAEEIIAPIREREKAEQEAQRAEEARQRTIPSGKQLAYLNFHGIRFSSNITRQEASDLIDKSKDKFPDSRWNAIKHVLHPDLYQVEAMGLEGYEQKLKDAKAELKALKAAKADEEEISDAEFEVESATDELQGFKDDREDEVNSWLDEVNDGGLSCEAEMYLEVFKKPTKSHILKVQEYVETHYKLNLGALTITEFFLIYSKVNPDALKKGKSCKFSSNEIIIPSKYEPQKYGAEYAKKSGCLGLIALLFALPFVFWKFC